ncbi:hypothetical protein [Thiobacillus sp. 0-1251]|uniref:hypothetical protein n=1 Tax=Thiobacillus sp. 0-1251 TaxID=1895858 RepID=UPI0009698490|nr:hypothetical protein [Thiobacillus sp. 0-1251]OJY59390.1 MAG: hypothetical protein BGP19_07495 [Thiobacillus sp. 0-1251]
MNRLAALSVPLLAALLLGACSSSAIQRKDGSSSVRSFSLRDLAKSDVDEVIEIHQQAALASLKTLTLKLYRRNPGEWRKSGYASADDATETLFKPLSHWHLSPQKDLNWQASLRDAWREDYMGDRVKALMDGLLVMHMAAFDHRTEFYLLSDVDAQKLYNAARNTEAVAWKLATARNARNEPLLLSNGTDGNGVINLSFEREFGKLIGNQDTLARIVEDKSNRAIRFGVVNLTSMVFLPV